MKNYFWVILTNQSKNEDENKTNSKNQYDFWTLYFKIRFSKLQILMKICEKKNVLGGFWF